MLHRADGPETSRDAAHVVDTTALEALVYQEIKACGADGCISDDVRRSFFAYPYSSITARYAALQRKGLIICGPDKRKGDSGKSQRVMRAVAQ